MEYTRNNKAPRDGDFDGSEANYPMLVMWGPKI